MSKIKSLTPADIHIGNFISCFGKTEIVKGITPRPDGSFFIHHSSTNQEHNPFGNGIEFDAYPILLTDQWREALRVDQYTFPEWVQYVHEAQNYIRWYTGHELLPHVIWELVPGIQEEYLTIDQ